MQQLPTPIKDASHNYATHNYFDQNEIQVSKSSFEAGAEWQKEQLNAHMQKVISNLENDFAKQLVQNVTNILFS